MNGFVLQMQPYEGVLILHRKEAVTRSYEGVMPCLLV